MLAIQADDERMQNFAASCKWPEEFAGIVGFGAPPFSNATLHVTLLPATLCSRRCPDWRNRKANVLRCADELAGPHGGRAGEPGSKFKILSLTSC